jgi:alpha-L-fucosidase
MITSLRTVLAAIGVSLATAGLARGQSAPVPSAAKSTPIDYATVQFIAPGDSERVIVEKAAKVLPRPNQTEWMRLERTFFLHFGPNTFRGVEWGDGRESPALFNPTALDAREWLGAVKQAGGKLLILVSKHHDGLCLWPSRYTTHSVAASPWREGKGNLVREVADAARAQGIKLGIYLSPADLYQLKTNPTNPTGYYGNGSPKVRSTIPTDPASFEKNPAQGRTPAPGFNRYSYEVDDYNRYFLNQLYELLTEYGPISDVWFDGANPDPSVHETYDYTAWYDLIHQLQPGAIISVKGPDARWVGNEGGHGRTTEWSVIPLAQPPERCTWPDLQANDLGSRAKLKPGSYLWWYPAEVNTPILYGWFWSATNRVKSPAELVDYFYRSVGRNGVMLLNLSPDTRGLIPDNQLAALKKMADVVDGTFAQNLANGATLGADSAAAGHGVELMCDRNLDTWWEAAPGHTTAAVTLTLRSPATFDVVSLQEAVDHRSQRIETFLIEVKEEGAWTTPETVDESTTVGYKRLLRLSRPVTADQIRIRITGSRLEPTLAEVGLFRQSLPQQPVISDRSRDGLVTLRHPHHLRLVYTLDGSEPTRASRVYDGPISLPEGGTVQAAVVTTEGQMGLSASKSFIGLAPTGWKVVRTSGDAEAAKFPASNAIDADARSLWQAPATSGAAPRPALTIDMGRIHRIAGFAYLPRQDWVFRGVVDRYRFETSTDGAHWTEVSSGAFGNIRNNPTLQEVSFTAVDARYFRFTALHDVDDNGFVGAAELTVIQAGGAR